MNQVNWRRILVIYLCGGFVLGGLYLAAHAYVAEPSASVSSSDGPKISIVSTQHDFGQVQAGESLRHEFVVQNHGATRLVLNEDSGGCCGNGELESPLIAGPGGQIRIPVRLETAGRSGFLENTVTMTTSDRQQPRIELKVTAQITGEEGPAPSAL